MIRGFVFVVGLVASSPALATPAACGDDPRSQACASALIAEATQHATEGRTADALQGFQLAYAIDPRPELLFAMAQMELNLNRLEAALALYQRYLATKPGERETAITMQAIAVVRDRIDNPPPPPPKPLPPLPPRLIEIPADKLAWSFAIGSGVASLSGVALFAIARQRTADVSGGYADYDRRVDRGRALRIGAIVAGGVGAALATVAVVRWLRRDRLTLNASDGAIGVALGGRL